VTFGINQAGDVLYIHDDEEVHISFSRLTGELHALAIQDGNRTLIACREIVGPMVDDDMLVPLRPVNDSGYAGIAIIEDEDDDDETEIKLYVISVEDGTLRAR
jgi:hypothetical protein